VKFATISAVDQAPGVDHSTTTFSAATVHPIAMPSWMKSSVLDVLKMVKRDVATLDPNGILIRWATTRLEATGGLECGGFRRAYTTVSPDLSQD